MMFLANGYTEQWFQKLRNLVDTSTNGRSLRHDATTPVGRLKKVYWSVPYIRELYDSFKRRLKQLQSQLPGNINIVPVYR